MAPGFRLHTPARQAIIGGMTTQNLIFMALAGGAGALCRYGLSGVVQRLVGERFPAGTLVVNLLGCLLFGLIWGWLEGRAGFSPQTRLVVLTGFMGAFTTFSTFAFETAGLLQGGQWLAAALNVGAQTVAGVVLVLIGMSVAQHL
jgi:CrcB protein